MNALRAGSIIAGVWFILVALDMAPDGFSEDYWLLMVGLVLLTMWLPPVKRNTKSKEGTQ